MQNVKENLEQQGRQQIVQALQKAHLDAGFLVPNKCADCDYRTTMTKTIKCTTGNFTVTDYGCELDDRVFNALGCDKDLLGNNARGVNPNEESTKLIHK